MKEDGAPDNPYAAPTAEEPPPPLAVGRIGPFYFTDGRFLIVRDGAELPTVCPVSNRPVDQDGWRNKTQISYTPPWVFLLILVNVIILLIVALAIQKKAKITYSLAPDIRAGIVRKRSIGAALLILSAGCFVVGFNYLDRSDHAGILMLLALLLLIASLVFFVIANPMKALKCKDGWFKIKGCSSEFLSTLPTYTSPF